MVINSMKKPIQLAALVGLIFTASCKNETTNNKSELSKIDSASVPASEVMAITEQEVNDAQQAWCFALVKIDKIHSDGGDAKTFALQVLTDAYNYYEGKVFFKPTLAFEKNTFRNTKEDALAYFVRGNPNFSEDKGFALTPWVRARYDNAGEGNNGIQNIET